MVGAKELVKDSKQPVHSWNDRYTTLRRGEVRTCSAMAAPIQGGSAMADATAVQYWMKPRRLMPCLSSISPTVDLSLSAIIPLSSRPGARPISRAHAAQALPQRSHRLRSKGSPAHAPLPATPP